MKICTRCRKHLGLECFNKNRSKRDGLSNICKDCSRLNSRNYYKEFGQKHRQFIKTFKADRRIKDKELINKIKLNNPCACGEKEPACLDFHHLSDKEMDVSQMIGAGYSQERILKEINKCIILCSNCHRKLHAGLKIKNTPVAQSVDASPF